MPKPIPTPDRLTTADLPPELERRIAAIERGDAACDLNAASWFWLLLFGVALPAALLMWGWWA